MALNFDLLEEVADARILDSASLNGKSAEYDSKNSSLTIIADFMPETLRGLNLLDFTSDSTINESTGN